LISAKNALWYAICFKDFIPASVILEITLNRFNSMKTRILSIALLALATLSSSAKADMLFSFSYTADGINASGDLTTSDVTVANVDGSAFSGFDILGITGQRNGVAITGLIDNPAFPGATDNGAVIYDNILLTSPFGFDNDGLFYVTGSDGHEYNLFSTFAPTGGGYSEYVPGTGAQSNVDLTLTLVNANVPDTASTALLLASGIAACLIASSVARRRAFVLLA
jgi:hypothetical protein